MDNFDEANLLNYETHNAYLDSFVSTADLNYLRSSVYSRQIASLGYRYKIYYILSVIFF